MRIKCALLIIPILLAGCFATIAPKPVDSKTQSFSGTNSNSGILGTRTNSEGEVTSILIDGNDVNRYNYFIKLYSKKFAPPLKKNDGITQLGDNLYEIDAQHFADFSVMNHFFKNHVK